MSGTALMYMLANMFLTQLFYVIGVGGVKVMTGMTGMTLFLSSLKFNVFILKIAKIILILHWPIYVQKLFLKIQNPIITIFFFFYSYPIHLGTIVYNITKP